MSAVKVTLQYFPGCPNWRAAEAQVCRALELLGLPRGALALQVVLTPEDAEAVGFRGSPTVLVDGVDPFADLSAPVGLSCRLFPTEEGLAGSPTLAQLLTALGDHA